MKKIVLFLLGFAPILAFSQQTLSLNECYNLVAKNYPLAKQVNLLQEKSTAEINLLERNKLPQLEVNAQLTYQSDVIQFPLENPNFTIEPPNNDQYRATLVANQLIYNGGSIDANSRLKTAELATKQQQIAVNLYALKTQINQNFFSILLFQEQKKLLQSKMEQLNARLNELRTGVEFGATLPNSELILKAELLKLEQQLSQTTSNKEKALNSLSSLLSQNLDSAIILINTDSLLPIKDQLERPEIKLFDLQNKQLETSKEVISKSNFPKLMGFVEAGYGNPGLNMLDNSFQDFYMLGLKLNWNIIDWGKTKEKKQVADISKEIISTEKETFLLNNQIQQKNAESDINKYEKMLQKDAEIIELRKNVLKAATSQFKNGILTPSEYVTELNNLYEAKIDHQIHKIQLSLAKANYSVIIGK